MESLMTSQTIKYRTVGQIPMFRGMIADGTLVTITKDYGDVINVITDDGVEIHGITRERIRLANETLF